MKVGGFTAGLYVYYTSLPQVVQAEKKLTY